MNNAKNKCLFNGYCQPQVFCDKCSALFVVELLVIYEPTMNNGFRLLCYQIAICCVHTSALQGIQRLPPTLIMNLEFVLPGSLTMVLKGQANPDGFGIEKKKSTWGSKFAAQWLAGCLGTDGRRRHCEPIEIQDPKWLLLLCTHRQMMPLCQRIADMHLGRQGERSVFFFFLVFRLQKQS